MRVLPGKPPYPDGPGIRCQAPSEVTFKAGWAGPGEFPVKCVKPNGHDGPHAAAQGEKPEERRWFEWE